MASSAPMTVTPVSLPEREQVRPGAVTPAKRLTVSASKQGHGVHPQRKSPAGVGKWMAFIALARSANLKTCKQLRATYFDGAHTSA